jgi:hypothetical protein
MEKSWKETEIKAYFFEFILGNLEVAQFVQAKSGKRLLLDTNGYVYNRSSQNGTTLYWCCRNKDNRKCLARAISENEFVTSWKSLHNHPPNLRDSDIILNWNTKIKGYIFFFNLF